MQLYHLQRIRLQCVYILMQGFTSGAMLKTRPHTEQMNLFPVRALQFRPQYPQTNRFCERFPAVLLFTVRIRDFSALIAC